MTSIHFQLALTAGGWENDVTLHIVGGLIDPGALRGRQADDFGQMGVVAQRRNCRLLGDNVDVEWRANSVEQSDGGRISENAITDPQACEAISFGKRCAIRSRG